MAVNHLPPFRDLREGDVITGRSIGTTTILDPEGRGPHLWVRTLDTVYAHAHIKDWSPVRTLSHTRPAIWVTSTEGPYAGKTWSLWERTYVSNALTWHPDALKALVMGPDRGR